MPLLGATSPAQWPELPPRQPLRGGPTLPPRIAVPVGELQVSSRPLSFLPLPRLTEASGSKAIPNPDRHQIRGRRV